MPLRAQRQIAARRPLRLGAATITGGFWHDRRETNRTSTIPAAARRLEEAGTLRNLRRAAGHEPAGDGFAGKLFADTDVYKWLEAVAWEQARSASAELAEWQKTTNALVEAAQEPDGYLNSYVRLVLGGQRFGDLEKGHELYCAGHLLQAAVAQSRATGDHTLLAVATRFADLLCKTFGPGRTEGVDGHPLIEMALVELYRETGTSAYLELASYFVEARGHGLLEPPGHHGPAYFQDHLPVRDVRTLTGHAVRALYLAAGATDVAVETGDQELLDALRSSWQTMVESQTYLTGGVGSRWYGEAFGDPFELPPDAAYCETCAAIASVQWSWRLLLATGESQYADLIERTLYNAVISGVSLTGREFFYVNTLKVRNNAFADDQRSAVAGRQPWFGTACCPPNVMRTLSSLDQLIATSDDDGVQVHLYAPATVAAELAAGSVGLEVATRYPWHGRVTVTVTGSPAQPWTLALRLPAWAAGCTASVNGIAQPTGPAGRMLELRRTWTVGDEVVLDLPVGARRTVPDDRIDSVRGCVAIECGPLVYCFEQVDQDLVLDAAAVSAGDLVEVERPDLLGGVTTVEVPARDGRMLTAIPYYAWANREVGPMTVWIDAR
ncbi:glycoside hydrolase family 127 protein [Kribbella turkmenica]|uniref:Glycoside hydrolase family 127 protein n=1 Tax=Kribbella turkmenica TaxID=2530375 RepID=A0A4R4X961_9ACTN|nr:beta-L-arabinofuranosidase domain-containing protein [Kribbella turkmenica]TDD26869.1 glycoside hydrolase family 127 protein [Kribbella turkmenica]